MKTKQYFKSSDSKVVERTAVLKSLSYSGTLAYATFTDGDETFTLIGEQRMTSPISEYLHEEIRLYITDFANWSWSPLDDDEFNYPITD